MEWRGIQFKIKVMYVESKEAYDGFGREARKNTSCQVQADFAKKLKWIARRTDERNQTFADTDITYS
ncbi:unnamed protein product [Bathycoccus prasinos]